MSQAASTFQSVSVRSTPPHNIMSYARPGFLASIVASIDKEPDSREVAAVCAVVEKRKHADLAAARQLGCQKNRNLAHVAEEEDDIRARDQDAEVVESPDNPDDLDVHFETQAFEGKIAPLNKLI